LLLAAILGAAACGGDDDDSSSDTTSGTSADSSDSGDGHSKDEYVALMGGGDEGQGITDEEGDCFAGVLVDTIGVDTLEEAGAYEQIQDNPDGNLSDYGLTLDESQGAALYEGLNGCKDLRAFFEEQLASGADPVPPEAAACIATSVPDAAFARLWVVAFTDGEDAVSTDPEVSGALTQAATDCAAAG
jgi:hypothetical protein